MNITINLCFCLRDTCQRVFVGFGCRADADDGYVFFDGVADDLFCVIAMCCRLETLTGVVQTIVRLFGFTAGREGGQVLRHPTSSRKGHEDRSHLPDEGCEGRRDRPICRIQHATRISLPDRVARSMVIVSRMPLYVRVSSLPNQANNVSLFCSHNLNMQLFKRHLKRHCSCQDKFYLGSSLKESIT